MIQIGQIALLLSIPLAVMLIIGCLMHREEGDENAYRAYIYSCTSVIFILHTISFLVLMRAHLLSDLSVTNIISNTHSTQPMVSKIVGLWGNHEGSMLLWQWVLSLYTYSILFTRKLPSSLLYKTLMHQSILSLFFTTYIMVTSNPYLQISYNRLVDGMELNPILQDIVLSIHPPLVYAGYIGLSIPMSLTISNLLLKNNYYKGWLYYVKLYNTISWIFLTIGIFLGSWWAYYELGWGGWWFWDPVENASLMPWIISSALMHCVLSANKSNTLVKWTVVLSLSSFYSSILGTFFVRSGFLDSVHSFSSDNNRGYFILTLLILLFLYMAFIYSFYIRYLSPNYIVSIVSREGLIMLNQFFFVSMYFIVAVGTFYPVIYTMISGKGITIGPSFYNQAMVPIVLPYIVLMGITSYLGWKKRQTIHDTELVKHILFFIGLLIGTSFLLYLLNYKGPIVLYIFTPVLLWSLISTTKPMLTAESKQSMAMVLSHMGVIMFLAAVTIWHCFHEEKHLIMYPGEQLHINGLDYILRGVNVIKGPNYESFYGSFTLMKDGYVVGCLFPEKRYYYVQDFYTSKVDIHSNLLCDAHAIIGDGSIITGWEISIYLYTFMSWIWASCLVLVVSGLIIMWRHMHNQNY